MKKAIFVVLILFQISCSHSGHKQMDYGSNKQAGKYIDINDIKVYYEIYGKGEPLLLLHGGGGSIEDFICQIPELARHFKVIAVDSRAQGRSTDSEKEITYALMASDMAVLIDKLDLGSVYVLGFSDGGNIGLEMAYGYPDKVKKLIASGANYTHENWTARDDSVVMDPDDPIILRTRTILEKYFNNPERLSPDPGRLPVIKKKLENLWKNYPNFTLAQLKTIKTPALIIAGDHDLANIDQTLTLFRSIPNSRLFIVPGASHFALIEYPGLLNSVIIDFLKTPFRRLDNRYFYKELFSK